MKGTVRKWIEDKGYGFIDGDDGESYFIHYSFILPIEGEPKVKNLEPGQRIKFEPAEDDRGLQAKQAILL